MGQLIRDRPSETRYLYHVNLLPYNVARAVQDSFARVGAEEIESFQQVLQQAGISSSYRNSFGHSIDAACGQLFAGYEQKGKAGDVPPLVSSSTSRSLSTPASKSSGAPILPPSKPAVNSIVKPQTAAASLEIPAATAMPAGTAQRTAPVGG